MRKVAEKILTASERHNIQVAAELMIALCGLPGEKPIDGNKVEGTAKALVRYEKTLMAREEELREVRERLGDE